MAATELSWCIDILKRIKEAVENKNISSDEKVQITAWLVKQALKVERED